MDLNFLKEKKVAILGLGIEGISLAKFLNKVPKCITLLDELTENQLINRAEQGQRSDIKHLINDKKNYSAILGKNYLNNLTNYDLIFRTPGIPYLDPKIQEAEKCGVEISSQIKLFFDLSPSVIVGVTGTKGKGTTASLIHSILMYKQSQDIKLERNKPKKADGIYYSKVYIAGNIGHPAVDVLKKATKDDLVILELSSFQLQDLKKSPQIAVVTNLGVDHLDYHCTKEEYNESKKSIFKYQNDGDYLVINKAIGRDFYKDAKAKIKTFSALGKKSGEAKIELSKSNEHQVSLKVGDKYEKIVSESEIQLVGDHNLENIAAASLVADILSVDISDIREGIKIFKGLPHRLELVAEIGKVKYYNDSFATNPDPTIAALNSFSADKIVILGGSSKNANFSNLAHKIVSINVKATILIGDEAKKISSALKKYKFEGVIYKATTLDNAITKASELAEKDNVILFSPACASFDMFKNYKDRGDKFKEKVLKMAV